MPPVTVPVYQQRKPWYLSRTLWGAILAGTAGLISTVVPTLDPSAPAWVHQAASFASMAGGGLAAYGRFLVTTPPPVN